MSKALEFTGERFTPECVREIWYEHVHRYVFALEMVSGLRVLDAACGEGYGSALLAGKAGAVTGVDVSNEAIEHAKSRYSRENLEFRVCDCLDMPFGDGEFDCVVSFETLEHLEDHDALLQEFRRVLKPEGFLLLSTPDKAVYTDRQENRNEYHVKELYRDELEGLLAAHFPAYKLFGHKLMFHSAIWSLEESPGVTFNQESENRLAASAVPQHDPVYFIAVCAAAGDCLPQPEAGVSLFDDAAESVYEHYYHEIRKNMSAGAELEKRERELAALKAAQQNGESAPGWWRRLLGKS